jgi:hypothetical protein
MKEALTIDYIRILEVEAELVCTECNETERLANELADMEATEDVD